MYICEFFVYLHRNCCMRLRRLSGTRLSVCSWSRCEWSDSGSVFVRGRLWRDGVLSGPLCFKGFGLGLRRNRSLRRRAYGEELTRRRGGTEAYGEELTEKSLREGEAEPKLTEKSLRRRACEKERRNRSLRRGGEGKRQGGRRALHWSGVVFGDGFSFLGAVYRKRMNKFCGTLEKC